MRTRHLIYKAILALAAATAIGALPGCRSAKLSTANEQRLRGEYFEASKTYRKVYNKLTKKEQRSQRGEVAYLMGLCYDKLSMSARASSAFGNAIRYGYPDSTAILLMAQSLQAEGKYAQAKKAYNEYLEKDPQSKAARNGLAGCEIALQQRENPRRLRADVPRPLDRGPTLFHHHQREGHRRQALGNHRHEEGRHMVRQKGREG